MLGWEREVEAIRNELPENVLDYFRRNANRLLNAPESYVLQVYNYLMKRPLDAPVDQPTKRRLAMLLEDFDTKQMLNNIFGKEEEPQYDPTSKDYIKAIFSDPVVFPDDNNSILEFITKAGTTEYCKLLVQFVLDGETIVIMRHVGTGTLLFMKEEEDPNDDEYYVYHMIEDPKRLTLLKFVWESVMEPAYLGEL